MSLAVFLRLGRVSNLPTVWTNALAGAALAGGAPLDTRTLPLIVALSLFYVGGMYLNDAFDADIDAAERPDRPIPAGAIARSTVFALGFGMLAAGVLILGWVGYAEGGTGAWPALSGLALAAAITAYDVYHKQNPLSPVLMGACRALVYVTAGVCFAVPVAGAVLLGAALLLCYLIGLTYVAKQEHLNRVQNLWPLAFLAAPLGYGALAAPAQPALAVFWLALAVWTAMALRFVKRRQPGDVPRAVVSLIAGISLVDALLIAGTGATGLATLALLGFVLTLALQRWVPGT